MLLKKSFITLLLVVTCSTVFSQKKNDYKQHRILILLDGSSSMIEKWNNNQTRFQTAGSIVTRLMDSVYHFNPNVEFALRVYGHQHSVPEKNCFDTKREVNFSKDNYTQMLLRLESLKPIGVSPIAYSLKEAAETDFNDSYNYAYSLVLITDGGESCNGNICDVVKNLLDKRIEFKPYIISLVDYQPLRDQYACLGNYLLASTPNTMDNTIREIAKDYKRVLNIPIAKPVEPAVKNAPPIVVTPVKEKENIEPVTRNNNRDIAKEPTTKPALPERTIPAIPLPTKEAEPTPVVPISPKPIVAIKKEKIAKLKPRTTHRLLVKNDIRPTMRKRAIAKIGLPAREEEPIVALKKEEIAKLKTNTNLRSFGLFWSTPSLKKRPIERITIPPKEPTPIIASANTPKPAPVRPATAKPIVPKTPNRVVIKDASFSVKTEPATNTTLQVFFTDGKGKFYQTTPPVALLDSKTNKEIKRFYRTVGPDGNPDPQNIPPGTYTVLVGKKGNFRAKNVTILANNNNKVSVIATNGTLSFRYTDNFERPIDEFTALVKKNFEPGPVMTQPCIEEKFYESGSYHIEVNTNPISRFYIDLDFATDFIIQIDEPGYLSITNTNSLGRASLYYQNGDMFSKFDAIDVNGNPALQKKMLKPGAYEIRYKENAAFQSSMEKSVKVIVRSNTTTEILLQ